MHNQPTNTTNSHAQPTCMHDQPIIMHDQPTCSYDQPMYVQNQFTCMINSHVQHTMLQYPAAQSQNTGISVIKLLSMNPK